MSTKIKVRLQWFVTVLLTSHFVVSCAINPVTGKKELSFMTYDDELRIGRDADRQITQTYGIYVADPEISQYVEKLGQSMAKVSHRPFLKFHFRVLDSPVVNAFALPGGYVYVTRGLLAYMNSEAELAGVIGHEIGHITARHGARQYSRSQLAQIGLTFGYAYSPAVRAFGNVVEFGVGMLFLKFSRDQEQQSDSLGVEYSSRMGYDATNMANFFTTINRLQEQSDESLPTWLSTHPDPLNREVATLRMAKRWQQELPPYEFETDRERYLDHIDGLLFGEEPRQGFVENGYFYHPILDFQLPVPEGWQLMNTPQQVQIINRDQTAMIQLTLAEATTPKSALAAFLRESSATVIRSENTKINGYETEVREVEIRSGRETVKALSYFIQKKSRIFVLQGITTATLYKETLPLFQKTMDNFNHLQNGKQKNVKPPQLKVETVDKSGRLKDFLGLHKNKWLSLEQMAILNGRALSDTLRPGDRIKLLAQ